MHVLVHRIQLLWYLWQQTAVIDVIFHTKEWRGGRIIVWLNSWLESQEDSSNLFSDLDDGNDDNYDNQKKVPETNKLLVNL